MCECRTAVQPPSHPTCVYVIRVVFFYADTVLLRQPHHPQSLLGIPATTITHTSAQEGTLFCEIELNETHRNVSARAKRRLTNKHIHTRPHARATACMLMLRCRVHIAAPKQLRLRASKLLQQQVKCEIEFSERSTSRMWTMPCV